MKCRFCSHQLDNTFLDLGHCPPSNSFLSEEQLVEPETNYPLKAMVCTNCLLVQVPELKNHAEIFNDKYVYFSSMSRAWLEHSKRYAEMAKERFDLKSDSQVMEIASNDGYLLQYFKGFGIPCLGIEPSTSTAVEARKKGIETIEKFFDDNLARELRTTGTQADLLVGNNVLAHVPNLNEFVMGLNIALKDNGVVTMEFPHLYNLVREGQFDTIYHEHFSYFSFETVRKLFRHHGLEIFDVDQLETHGGSLRIYAKKQNSSAHEISERVSNLLEIERSAGMNRMPYYQDFGPRVEKIKRNVLKTLVDEVESGRKVIAYGAAAKGNTLLNYCGIKPDLVSFAIDTTPFKQGKYMPGSHIPVYSEEKLKEINPEQTTIFILPWNHKKEILGKLSSYKDAGARFFTAIPEIEFYDKQKAV